MTVKKPRSLFIAAVVGATALGTACQFVGALPALAAPVAAGSAPESVIVLLHDQLTATPADRAHVGARRAQATSSQDAVLSRLAQRGGTKPTRVRHYTAANALSLTATPDQVAALTADPAVAAVIPDSQVAIPVRTKAGADGASTNAPRLGTPPSTAVCPTDPSKPLLEPEALAGHQHRLRRPAGQDRPAAHRRLGHQGRLHRRRDQPRQPRLHPGRRFARDRRLQGVLPRRPDPGRGWRRGLRRRLLDRGPGPGLARPVDLRQPGATRCRPAATSASWAWRPAPTWSP